MKIENAQLGKIENSNDDDDDDDNEAGQASICFVLSPRVNANGSKRTSCPPQYECSEDQKMKGTIEHHRNCREN